jgi:medium-chain acyl-[acyl-carrier-protein] hydrolase
MERPPAAIEQSRYVLGTGTVSVTDWFIPLSFIPLSDPDGAADHVYAFPQAGGGCSTFAALADLLAPDAAVWGLNLPGRQARFLEPPRTALDPLLDELAADLAPRGRPVLFGYCSGALLAFLLARRLRRDGLAQPASIIIASYPAPDRAAPPKALHTLGGTEFWQEILSYGGVPDRVAGQPDFREIFEVALRADYELLAGYEYTDEPPLDVPITVLTGDADPVLQPADIEGWRKHTTGAFRTVRVPAGHWLLDGDLGPIAETLRESTR